MPIRCASKSPQDIEPPTVRLQQLQDGDLELPGASDFDQRLTETRCIFYAEWVVQGCAPAGPAPEAAVTAGSLRAAQAARAAHAP